MKLSKTEQKPLGEPQKPEKRREELNHRTMQNNADMIHQERTKRRPEQKPA